MNRKEGSGRPRSVTTEENTGLTEVISSQEEAPHRHLPPRRIAEQTGISFSSIRKMIKRRNFRQFKRVKNPEMKDGCRNRRYARAIVLAGKFERSNHMIEKTVSQDEKDFTLDIPFNLQNDRVYRKGKKSHVPDQNLFASTNKMSRKFLVSLATAPQSRFL